MAALTGHTAVHATLGVATVDSVVLDTYGKAIQIIHRGATTNAIYCTVGNIASTTAVAGVPGTPQPVSLANDTIAVTAGQPLLIAWPPTSAGVQTACVKLICATGEPYSVQVVNEPFG